MNNYDNPRLLLAWEREYIRTCVRFYTDRMRDFLEKNPNIEGGSIQRWEERQDHIIEKLKQFKDLNEPEPEEGDDDE